MAKGPMRSEALEATWRARIARQQQSGRTGRSFCRQEKLKESAFYYWRRELSRRDGQSSGTSVQRAARQPRANDFSTLRVMRSIWRV
jgi:transposase-like protein